MTWQQATTSVHSFHTIAALVFHMKCFVGATIRVLRGGALDATQKLSFDCPPISTNEDWEQLLNRTWVDAEELASLIECLPDKHLAEHFADGRYGTVFRCLQGLVEHCHYHLGQIAEIKGLLDDASRQRHVTP